MRGLALAIAAAGIAVSGCGQGAAVGGAVGALAPTSAWTLKNEPDRVTGVASPSLGIQPAAARYSASSRRQGFASSSVVCADKKPIVMFVFDFPVGSKGTSVLSYRFDQKPGQQVAADFFNTSAPLIRDTAQVQTFLDQAIGSHTLYVRVSSPVGLAEVEFNVSGGEPFIQSFKQQCTPT